jgi:hypothetical protein
MFDRLIPVSLFRWIHLHDDEFRRLAIQTDQLQDRLVELGRKRASLETELSLSQDELTNATEREEQLKQKIANLQEELQNESWADSVLSDDFIAGRVSPHRKHAWLVAAPKSGSTWFTNMLIQLLGWQPHMLTAAWDRREQEIDVRRMLEFPSADLFSIQQHCRFSQPTCDFIKRFHVQIILQGRNLWDSVVSLRDHFLRESTATPVCYVDEGFLREPPDRQLDAVIDLAVPWYLNFYASWFTARHKGEVGFLWVDYELLSRDPAGQLRRTIEYLGLSRCDEEIQAALDHAVGAVTRLNVGRAGRGADLLSPEQKQRISRLRTYYPQVDFSPIGLE